jgi:hypothetical protein
VSFFNQCANPNKPNRPTRNPYKPTPDQIETWINPHIGQSLHSTASDYIQHGQWNLPPQLSLMFNNLSSIVSSVTIPLDQSSDKFLWKHTDTSDLELKQAYCFKMQQFQDLLWAKLIWNPTIPPSKSLMVWRLMHRKMPTDENLMYRL